MYGIVIFCVLLQATDALSVLRRVEWILNNTSVEGCNRRSFNETQVKRQWISVTNCTRILSLLIDRNVHWRAFIHFV
eukprot:scaffold5681_cov196-Alexandrium_tamarense.AAC.5